MGKKASRRRMRDDIQERSKVRALFPSNGAWSPLENGRPPQSQQSERSYTRNVKPCSDNQRRLLESIDKRNLVVAVGPAGTGKTFLAIAKAVEALEGGKTSRIILSRPAVEAGESLGFLPGALEDKLAPYLRPLYDALSERLGGKRLKTLLAEGIIEIAPVAYMRGRTLNNAFIVIDEAQNCTYGQLKMLLTRLGWHSTMVMTGDPDQTDLLPGISGLGQVADRLSTLDDIAVVRLEDRDIVRHPLVAAMLTVL
jgi:phosphate starvation-inducible PhoH-like protein